MQHKSDSAIEDNVGTGSPAGQSDLASFTNEAGGRCNPKGEAESMSGGGTEGGGFGEATAAGCPYNTKAP